MGPWKKPGADVGVFIPDGGRMGVTECDPDAGRMRWGGMGFVGLEGALGLPLRGALVPAPEGYVLAGADELAWPG